MILTPVETTDDSHVERTTKLWQSVGAIVSSMNVQEHDQILAATSHLPHFLAYSLVDTLAGMNEKTDIFRYAAGGFRDFTRIAASDPIMWRDIAIANKNAVIDVMDKMMDNLTALRASIEAEDKQAITQFLFDLARREIILEVCLRAINQILDYKAL